MEIFNRLFNYDFSKIEQALDIDCFSIITNYTSIEKRKQIYNKSVSKRVRQLSDDIRESIDSEKDEASAAEKTLKLVSDFYKNYGVGMLGLNKAFRIGDGLKFIPISNSD